MEDIILYIVRNIVSDPDAVKVEKSDEREGFSVYNLTVAEQDKGLVKGKHGRVAKALRTIARIAADKKGERIKIDII